MAEVASSSSRPPASRGRSAGRAGRAGQSSRGATRSTARQSSNLSKDDPASTSTPVPSLEEQGELGKLKLQYKSQLDTLSELFPDWTDDDLVFALQETDGDLQTTIERITEGNVSQFADVKKKTKDKSRSKKDILPAESVPVSSRSRGRGGHDSTRGGRGRGSERGGRARASRGGSSIAANGERSTSTAPSVPTTEIATWGDSSATADSSTGQWGSVVASDITPATASEGQKSSLIPEGSKKSWASMLAQKATPTAPKPVAAAVPPKPLAPDISSEPRDLLVSDPTTTTAATAATTTTLDSLAAPGQSDIDVVPSYPSSIDTPASLAPPKDQLTEDNLDAIPDESVPAPTDTVASTRDASSLAGNLTPHGSSGQVPTITRPPLGGYATSAWKATAIPGRSVSYQRRMMEQREAVVMPGNHAVDRAAIQFGNMGLNGEGKPLDVDEDREETQTRTLPQQSPPSQPRASLPPAPRQPPVSEPQPLHEGIPNPKPAPGLPLVSHAPSSMSNPATSQNPLTSQSSQTYGPYGRLPGTSLNQDPAATAQKGYDPFSQQLNYSQAQQDNQSLYQTHSQSSNPTQQLGNYGQTSGDSAHQYSSEQQRIQNYYGGAYNQQQQLASGQQDQNVPPQRSGSGFAGDSGYGSAQATTASASRMSESQNSGHTTPNQTMAAQHQMGPHSQQTQHMHQQPPGQAGHAGNFPYQNSYYGGSSYYNTYMSGYPNSYYGQQGYGAPYGGKNSMYGQAHHGYGMNPQSSYEHSSSPANAGTFGSSGLQGRDSMLSGGLADYSRSGPGQPTQPSTSSGGAFSNTIAEGFSRGAGGFGPNQHFGQQQQQQQQQSDESLKGFNEAKTGPSPALGQPGRSGSAVNNAAYSVNQSNFAPPQQSAFGGYPSHLNQLHSTPGTQYGGLGGLGGHQGTTQGYTQGHQPGGYGGYGSGFSNTYGGNYGGRGGWGGNYGGH